MRRRAVFLLALSALLAGGLGGGLGAQQLPPEESLLPEDYDPAEFPMWTHDLRRFEVVGIGSFPITFFATSLVYDFSTYAAHGWDPVYAMGTQRDRRDIGIIVGTAAGLSVAIATVDMIINVRKRHQRDAEE